MADITLRLCAYRLREHYTNLVAWSAELSEWYSQEFSWRRVEILDMLVLGWVLLGLIVVGLVNIYLHFFGPSRKAIQSGATRGYAAPGTAPVNAAGESCHWVNAALSWLHSQAGGQRALADRWLQALNEESQKAGGPLVVSYQQVQLSDAPPKFTHITTETGAKDTFTLRTHGEWSGVTLSASAAPSYASDAPNCQIHVEKLRGLLNVFSQARGHDMLIEVSFVSPPEMTVKVTKSAHTTQNDLDTKAVERLAMRAIENAVTKLSLTAETAPFLYASQSNSPKQAAIQPNIVQPSMASNTLSLPSTSIKDKRLLVKVIKASGLGDNTGTCDAYCVVEMDTPPQSHMTSVAHNTTAPFWDEHFLFDLSDKTQALKFVIYNRDRKPGEDLLGDAVLSVNDLKQTTSSRQIIPLKGPVSDRQVGSVTAEFLMMEPAEAQSLVGNGVSPRRHIDTSRQVTPGGTVITTTTTTTEKPLDRQQSGQYQENPNLITKTNSSGNFYTEGSPYPSSLTSSNLPDNSLSSSQDIIMINGSESVTQTALRELEQKTRIPRTPTKTSTIIITGVHRMTDSSPTEEFKGSPSASTGSSEQRGRKEKKEKKSFANTLRKRFSRSKKRRSQSADRAVMRGQDHLLKPPDQQGQARTTGEGMNTSPGGST